MNKETLRMQMLAGIITEGQYRMKLNEAGDWDDDDEDDFDLNQAFISSPEEHSYDEVLDIIRSYEDEGLLNKFNSTFPSTQSVKRDEYVKFLTSYIDDMSEMDYIKANWVSLTDDDIYEKAGLI